jgi:succinoglycan biosynthesis protein ExoA
LFGNREASWPKISVIIPVRNEERFIGRTLEYLRNQDYPPDRLEILVVDGRSDDSTREVVERYAGMDKRIGLLDNPGRLSSAGRNIGAKTAEGDILTFVDGHVYIDNDLLLKNIAVMMKKLNVSVLSRPQFLDTPDNSYFQGAVAAARRSVLGHGLDSTIYLGEERPVDPTSSGASYKREVFEKVGYFDENFDAAEDVEFNYRVARAGFESYTSPKLAVYYYPRDGLMSLFRQMARYGVGRYRLFRKHKTAAASGASMLALLAVGFIALALASVLTAGMAVFLGIYSAVYIGAVLVWSLLTATRVGLRFLPVLPLVYVVIHSGLAYGFLKEVLSSVIRRG